MNSCAGQDTRLVDDIRKTFAIFAVVLLYALVVYRWIEQMPLTLNIGSQPIAQVQSGVVTETVLSVSGGTGPVAAVLPAPSKAGNALVLVIVGAVLANGFEPPGWVEFVALGGVSTSFIIAVYPNNPGNIQNVTIQVTAALGTARWWTHLSEWSGVASIGTPETKGTATASAGTTLTPSTAAAIINPGDLAIAAWAQQIATNTATFTSPSGWTRLADSGALSRDTHLDAEYLQNPTLNQFLAPVLTSNRTTTDAVGGIVVLKAAHPMVDQTAYLKEGSQSIKLNTYDFTLIQGGRLALEDGSGFYLLEDGSGYLLLDTVVPDLGDPVALTVPTWNGRVVSVARSDLDDVLTNYRLVTIAATNSAAVSASPIAPGDLNDNPSATGGAGGYYLLEDSSGDYLLEGGTDLYGGAVFGVGVYGANSGKYELEGTTYGYRGLSVSTTQNIDGTVTTYGTATVFETGFAAGQTFLLTSRNLGYSAQQFTITNVTETFLFQGIPAYVLEFGDTYQSLQTAGGGILTNQGSEAVRQQGIIVPAGVLGSARVTADQGSITTEADLTGLTVTVTVASGRRLRITGKVFVQGTVANDEAVLRIYEDAAEVNEVLDATGGASFRVVLTAVAYSTPSAGVHTYKLTLQRQLGTGTLTGGAAASRPNYILVEDIGG